MLENGSKNISVLGSTGSIGRQTLEVCEKLGIRVSALAANSSVTLLEEQARRFSPSLVSVFDEKAAADLKVRLAVDWSASNSAQNNVALKSSKSFTAGTVQTVNLGSSEYDGASDITVMSVTGYQGEYYLCGNAGSTYNSGTVTVDMKILALWLE